MESVVKGKTLKGNAGTWNHKTLCCEMQNSLWGIKLWIWTGRVQNQRTWRCRMRGSSNLSHWNGKVNNSLRNKPMGLWQAEQCFMSLTKEKSKERICENLILSLITKFWSFGERQLRTLRKINDELKRVPHYLSCFHVLNTELAC